MHGQLSLPLDRKLQNSLILSMKSFIEERIRQSSIVILQLLYTHFHRDHREQQAQRRRSSTPVLGLSAPITTASKKATEETRNPNPSDTNTNPVSTNNNSTVKVSALVAHYSSSESPSTASSSSSSTTATVRVESRRILEMNFIVFHFRILIFSVCTRNVHRHFVSIVKKKCPFKIGSS